MKTISSIILLFLGLHSASAQSPAPVLYGVTFYDRQLLRLDPASGGTVVITNYPEPFRLYDI
jgi:hypothetical protein